LKYEFSQLCNQLGGTFNRTTLELKSKKKEDGTETEKTFNRTTLELK
jgi:hypothetical protein